MAMSIIGAPRYQRWARFTRRTPQLRSAPREHPLSMLPSHTSVPLPERALGARFGRGGPRGGAARRARAGGGQRLLDLLLAGSPLFRGVCAQLGSLLTAGGALAWRSC